MCRPHRERNCDMGKTSRDKQQIGFSKTWLFVVFVFGAAAFLVRWAGLAIPVIGPAAIDPREVFVTLGAASTGPVGGLVIGLLAGLATIPVEVDPSSLVAHSVSGLLIGLLYKLVYQRWRMPALLLGWAVLIAAYYYIFFTPTAMAVIMLVAPGALSDLFGVELSFSQAYILLARGVFPEVVATMIVTAIILIAMPERYRRPLW